MKSRNILIAGYISTDCRRKLYFQSAYLSPSLSLSLSLSLLICSFIITDARNGKIK